MLEPDEIARAIAAQDARALTRASGVGPRLAGRIVSELKDRVAKLALAPAATMARPQVPAGAGGEAVARPEAGVVEDTLAALEQLGYGRSEAYAVVARVSGELGPEPTIETLLTRSLKALGR